MDKPNRQPDAEPPSADWIYIAADSNEDLKAVNDSFPTKFLIENKLEKVLLVYWVDYDGALVPYMQLNIGEAREQATFATHSWLVTDESLKSILIFKAGARQMEHIVISPALAQTFSANTPRASTAVSSPPPLSGFEFLPNEWQFLKVENLGQVKAFSGLCTTSFKIENTTNEDMTVYWLNYEGESVPYMKLEPGESQEQQTYATHPWLVQDDNGRNLLLFVAGTQQQKLITVG